MYDESTLSRFWSKVEKTDGCWLWRGGRNGNGYGAFSLTHRKQIAAHRFAWQLANGPIPAGMLVCHTCDEPLCCRVSHLFLGRPADNSADMVAKGRQAIGDHVPPERRRRGEQSAMATHPEARLIGERHWKARLTWHDVDDLRARYAAGSATIDELSAEHPCVSRGQINRILRGEAWKRLGETPPNLGKGHQRGNDGRMQRG